MAKRRSINKLALPENTIRSYSKSIESLEELTVAKEKFFGIIFLAI